MKIHKDLPSTLRNIKILLADDDRDDRFFFKEALSELPFSTLLNTFEDGEQLLNYLTENIDNLPDVLFLDLNMPCKNGSESLTEIKLHKKFQQLPVIIYSTSLNSSIADQLYKTGAYYYIRKAGLLELKNVLHYILNLIVKNKFSKPKRNKFILNINEI